MYVTLKETIGETSFLFYAIRKKPVDTFSYKFFVVAKAYKV